MDLEFKRLPKERVVDTVFWGGGTPGLLAAKDLERLGSSLRENLSKQPKEWTIEMAPSTVKTDKLKVLKDLGVTRISMGVQSFDPELLQSLGRLHNPKQIYTAWERIEAAGFDNTNLDLMFAIPNQTIEQWEADIHEAARLAPTHLSTYCLTFEEDTALYVKLSQGKVSIDEDKELRFYERGWELLDELGYTQYEISNFSKKGAECIHNIHTWEMDEWIGCGPSAASQYLGKRYQRPSCLNTWIDGIEKGQALEEEPIDLCEDLLYTDSLVFGLRMNRGVDLSALVQRFPDATNIESIRATLGIFEKEGLLKILDEVCRLTHKGRLVCDSIGSELMSC